MPAMIAHSLFLSRVQALCDSRGVRLSCPPMQKLGAQGPDVLFFHRVLPSEPGTSYALIGSRLHRVNPTDILKSFSRTLAAHPRQREAILGYIDGFLCHYALDRTAHPFICSMQDRLRREDPAYGASPREYHFRIESALDILLVRKLTGRCGQDFPLDSLLPADIDRFGGIFALLYVPLLSTLFRLPNVDGASLQLAPADMRHAAKLLTNRGGRRFRLLHGAERLLGQRHILTSLMRDGDASDYDYANLRHRVWSNPHRPELRSNESFYELFDRAADEAVSMITAFHACGGAPDKLAEITQDRGFGSNLPGLYL